MLSLAIHEKSSLSSNESSVWEIPAGKYKVYGLSESRPNVSTKIQTPLCLSVSTLNTPPAIHVKIEPGIHTIIHLCNSYDGDEPLDSTPIVEPSLSSLHPPLWPSFLYALTWCVILPHCEPTFVPTCVLNTNILQRPQWSSNNKHEALGFRCAFH